MTEQHDSSTDDATHTDHDGEPPAPWWHTVGFGLFFLAATVGVYFYIVAFEAGDAESTRIWWPVALIYNFAGKWPVVGIGTVLGLFMIALGANDYRSQKGG